MTEDLSPATRAARFRRRLWGALALLCLGAAAGFYYGAKRLRDADLDLMEALVASGGAPKFTFRRTIADWLPPDVMPHPYCYHGDRAEYEESRRSEWLAVWDRIDQVDLADVDLQQPAMARLIGCPTLRRLTRGRLDAGDVETLARFRQVRELDLRRSKTDGMDLRPLARMPLREFNLVDTDVDDARLAFLGEIETLETLQLAYNPRIDGRFLESRARWESLETLELVETRLDDEAVVRIAARCPNLRTLEVSGFRLDGGAEALAAMPRLESLLLQEVQCRGDALRRLAGSKSLRDLNLIGSTIEGDGWLSLAAIPTLERLSVRATSTSYEEVDAFRKLRPDVAVTGPASRGWRGRD